MKLTQFVLPVLLCLILACASTPKEPRMPKAEVPDDWQRIDLEEVSFAIPPGLADTQVAALTGVVRRYQGPELQVNVHYGDFASTLSEFENASGGYEWLEVDGRRARGTSAVIDKKAYDGLFVPEPGKDKQPLSLLCVSLSPAAREQAMLVLQTVAFH